MITSSVMTRHVVMVPPAMGTAEASRIMQRLRIRHLPVVDMGRLVGMLSDRDLLRRESEIPCGEAMTKAPVTCSADSQIDHIAQLMLDYKIDSIPITDSSGALIGLVTSTDLLSLFVRRDAAQQLPFTFQVRLARTEGEALCETF